MIGYGSRFDLPELSASEIGVLESSSSSFGVIGLLRILFTIVEVGASLIPGVGPGLATGIALAGAGAQTGLDIATGQVNPLNVGINFGSAGIPGLTAGIKNIRAGSRIIKAAENQAAESLSLSKNFITDAASAIKNNDIDMATIFIHGSQIASDSANDLRSGINAITRNPFTSPLKQFERGFNTAQTARGLSQELIRDVSGGAMNFGKEIANELNNVARIGSAAAEGVTGTEEDIRRILTRAGLTEEELLTLNQIIRLTEGQALRRQEAVLSYLKSIRSVDEARKIIQTIVEELIIPAAKVAEVEAELAGKAVKKGFWQRYVRALKRPSSAEFNDLIVQPTQAIFDASDLGRAPIEFAYKKLKQELRQQFKKLSKILQKAEKIDDLEDAFVKAGGIKINSSVIMGYKVISEHGHFNLVQISFNPFSTRAKHKMWSGRPTKNFGGKKPVYVQATDKDLAQLKVQGFSYYLKRWALNRGGAPVGVKFFGLGGLSPVAEAMLPFINTGLLRNVLSLSSNVVDNIADSIHGTGGWTKGWVDRFKGSFRRNYKNRIGRLFGKEVVGGAATAFFGHKIGAFIGREAQRTLSAVTQSINKAQVGVQGTFGQRFVTSFKGQIATRVATSVRGSVVRTARGRGGNAVTQSLSAQRKLGFVRRIPGAVLTPRPQATWNKAFRLKV